MTNPDPKAVIGYREARDSGLADWRWLVGALHARFATGDFATGLALVDRIGAAAEEADHHPDLDLRYPHLGVKLVSHDVGGVTDRDLRMARRISELAAELGVAAAPGDVQVLELGLDTADHARIRPFWQALLAMKVSKAHDELVDDDGQVPTIWFQGTDEHETPRQRWHLDIVVPLEQAQARIDAALAAGGTLVSDTAAPSFWVLSDADGNLACVCTPEDRDN